MHIFAQAGKKEREKKIRHVSRSCRSHASERGGSDESDGIDGGESDDSAPVQKRAVRGALIIKYAYSEYKTSKKYTSNFSRIRIYNLVLI